MMCRQYVKIVIVVMLSILGFLVLWPLGFLITQSLTSQEELQRTIGVVFGIGAGDRYARVPILPSWPTLEPLVELLLDTPEFFVVFWNTCAYTIAQVIGQVVVGVPAAWALSRLRFRGRKVLFALYIVLMILPFQVTMVPNYLVLNELNLMDTSWSMILPGMFYTFPVFIMVKGFDTVSYTLLEAARIDGSNELRTLWHIGIPLGTPGILVAVILGFLEAWNMLEQPMVFLSRQSLWPLSMYLMNRHTINLSVGIVASLLMLAPALLVFQFGEKYLEVGIQLGGIKE